MKMVLKVFFVFSLMVIPFLGFYEVKASSIPYGWKSDGQQIDSDVNNSASVTKDGYTVTLTLNNYNGGPLEEECYGTGVAGVTFNIELIGNNSITDLTGTGITLDYPNTKINFIGSGSLTIYAKTPISYENYTDYLYINPSQNIYTNVKDSIEEKPTTGDDSTIVNDNKSEDVASGDDNVGEENEKTDYTFIIMWVLIGYIVISIIMFILLFGKINKLKNDK